MHAVANVEAFETDSQTVGDIVDGANQLDPMPHDIEDAAAANADGQLLIDEDDGHADSDPAGGANPHEIDMQGRIGHRMVLHFARQSALRDAVHRKVDKGCEKAALGERARQLARLQADRHRILGTAVDDAGNAPRSPCGPGGALAGADAQLGGEGGDLGH